jgi:hypothetical protein
MRRSLLLTRSRITAGDPLPRDHPWLRARQRYASLWLEKIDNRRGARRIEGCIY